MISDKKMLVKIKKLDRKKQLLKNATFNKVRGLYDHWYRGDEYDYESSRREQRDFQVEYIMEQMEKDIVSINEEIKNLRKQIGKQDD